MIKCSFFVCAIFFLCSESFAASLNKKTSEAEKESYILKGQKYCFSANKFNRTLDKIKEEIFLRDKEKTIAKIESMKKKEICFDQNS